MKVAVIGAGHVGLVVAACLADFGLSVICADKDVSRIENLKKHVLPFFEPGLKELVEKNSKSGRLKFSADTGLAIQEAEVIFIAVGTEGGPGGGADLTAVFKVSEQIAAVIADYKVVVLKSTVPIGTAEAVAALIRSRSDKSAEFDVVSNPEFLREGSAIETFMRPNRVVLGSDSERAIGVMRKIYRPLYLIDTPLVITDNRTAELIKYASNAFLAMKISYINEMAGLSDAFGCDVHTVAKAVGLDKRIGQKFLHPGPGYGGSCLPKDTRALVQFSEERGVSLPLIKAVIRVNNEQASRIVEKVRKHLGSLEGRTIAVLGLAYKTNTDDVRESPALRVCQALLQEGAFLRAHDPLANAKARKVLGDKRVEYLDDPYGAAEGSDALMILTEWNEFRSLDLDRVRSDLSGSLVIDARNVFDPSEVIGHGLTYEGVGRTAIVPGEPGEGSG